MFSRGGHHGIQWFLHTHPILPIIMMLGNPRNSWDPFFALINSIQIQKCIHGAICALSRISVRLRIDFFNNFYIRICTLFSYLVYAYSSSLCHMCSTPHRHNSLVCLSWAFDGSGGGSGVTVSRGLGIIAPPQDLKWSMQVGVPLQIRHFCLQPC